MEHCDDGQINGTNACIGSLSAIINYSTENKKLIQLKMMKQSIRHYEALVTLPKKLVSRHAVQECPSH